MDVRDTYLQQYGITDAPSRGLYRNIGKRLFDLAVTLPLLLIASPAMLFTALLIKLDSRGPVFFVQERLGRYGTTFPTYKFRTMTDRKRTTHTEVLPGHSEVTRVGTWLRCFKLDELPQLLNIINGDMSLVGPRPALPEHIADYKAAGLQRLLERPGLTGLAQTNGNIYLSWPERWHYDARYVEQLSASLDLQVLIKSVAVVLYGEERFTRHVEVELESGNEEPNRIAA
ncbi:MAG: sugar transferase [Planctomycetota bacterium]|jgi:lipopolysaccharide/colanic/teichoic acid biosynthesis glycosyltransferase